MIGALLGHSNPRTTARYAHLEDNPKRQAAQRISGKIAEAMGINRAS
jgi:integrase